MRSLSRFPCSTPIQDRISAAFRRYSPNTRPGREIVYPENNGEWCRYSVSNASRTWKLTPSTHPRAVQKTWTIWNRYGRTYAKFCIFPSVSISNGRCLTRLRDIQTCGMKSGLLLYASPCYMVRWRRPATGTRWRCSVLKKKNNMCEIIINNLLLLVMSTKKYWTSVVCLRYVSFHLILNLQREKSSQQKGVHDRHGTMWHHHIITNESCFGHGCVTWFDDNHEKHNYMTQLMQPQGQDHHMLPRTNLGKKLYPHGQQDHIIYYEQ